MICNDCGKDECICPKQECGNCKLDEECHCVYDFWSGEYVPETWDEKCERMYG
jgi:hypothetical protein